MDPDLPHENPTDFLALAVRQRMLTGEQSTEVSRDAAARGATPADLVLEKGLMNAAQVDIVLGLQRPNDVAPGYQLLDVLGHGGLGIVYRARQTKLDRVVALKTIPLGRMHQQGAVARFEQEAKVVGRLHHPNIVAAYDYGTHAGRLYLAMELVEGKDLESYVKSQRRLDERVAWGIARQVASGLAHALELDIVHRDIKPGNLLLTEPPTGVTLPAGVPLVKIADFGLARLQDIDDEQTRLTLAGSTVGTPMYMAPEQLSAAEVDQRADIYALGATVFHMLTGQPPYFGRSSGEIMSEKIRGSGPPVAELPLDVSAATVELLAAMMASSPDERPGDYAAIIDQIDRQLAAPRTALANFAGDTPASMTTHEMPIVRSPAARSRTRWLFGAAATAMALATALWGASWLSRDNAAELQRLVPSGWQQPLYDGRTLDGWTGVRGSWAYARDAEGGLVLSGLGTAERKLPLPGQPTTRELPNYGVALGVDLNKATTVELQFGDTGDQVTASLKNVLRMTADQVLVGTRRGDEDLNVLARGEAPQATGDSGPRYYELRVERHGTHWLALFDGRPIGSLPASGPRAAPLIELSVTGGPAHFDALYVYELVASGEKTSQLP